MTEGEHCEHEKMCKFVILTDGKSCTGANCRAIGHGEYDTRQRPPHNERALFISCAPAHPPLDQEWICLEEDLSALTDYFIAALEGTESKSTLRRMWYQETGVIRSSVRSRPLLETKNDEGESLTTPLDELLKCKREYQDGFGRWHILVPIELVDSIRSKHQQGKS